MDITILESPSVKTDYYRGLRKLELGEAIWLATWREARAKAAWDDEELPFSIKDMRRHYECLCRMNRLRRGSKHAGGIGNYPDIVHSFKARRDPPREIALFGHYGIIGKGKGKYAFVRILEPNRIPLPRAVEVKRRANKIDPELRDLVLPNEQGLLAFVEHNKLIGSYLGLRAVTRWQSHLRKTVAGYGQVEVDELYIGRTHEGKKVVIAVEAKMSAGQGLLNVSQLYGISKLLAELCPDMDRRIVGIQPDPAGRICLVEFTAPEHIRNLTVKTDWVAYEII